MTQETIKTYQGSSIGASQCLVTLEGFIGDMENAELADDSTVDASDAVTAINGLIWEIERREAEAERLRAALIAVKDASRDGWEFRGGNVVPKWRLIAMDALDGTHQQTASQDKP